jgi:hypothetical protein
VERVEIRGADEWARDLEAAADRLPHVIETVVDASADALMRTTQANATHRPGPEDQTGAYLASWDVQKVRRDDPNEVARSVGTNEPQGHRLEWGFVGPDELGRTFERSPFPHLGPAIDVVAPMYQAALERAVDTTLPD